MTEVAKIFCPVYPCPYRSPKECAKCWNYYISIQKERHDEGFKIYMTDKGCDKTC